MPTTHQHHQLPADFCREVYDLSVKQVPSWIVSRRLAHDTLRWCRWLAPHLGIRKGKITVRVHDNQMAQVKYTVCESFDLAPQGDFDEVKQRRALYNAAQLLAQSKGCLPPAIVCQCVHTIFTILSRLSDQEFGNVSLKVREWELFELAQKAPVRAASEDAEDRLSRHWFPFY